MLIKEFLYKVWEVQGLNKLLKKLRKAGKMQQRSTETAWTDDNIDAVVFFIIL